MRLGGHCTARGHSSLALAAIELEIARKWFGVVLMQHGQLSVVGQDLTRAGTNLLPIC